MNINTILIVIWIIVFIWILASYFCIKVQKDLTKVQWNLNTKIGNLMYVLPSLLNLYKDSIANFWETNKALMSNTNNFFTQKINLKNIHTYIDNSQKDLDFLSQMVNKNFDQKKSFDTLYESIWFLEKVAPGYNLSRKIAKIFTFWLYSILERKRGFNKIKIIS